MSIKIRIKQILAMLGFKVERWTAYEKQQEQYEGLQKQVVDRLTAHEGLQKQLSQQVEFLSGCLKNQQNEFESYMVSLDNIRVESTNCCNYHCIMCPHDRMKRPKGFLSIDDLQWILKNITAYRSDFNGLFELHNDGEVLLDKALPEKIDLVRHVLPKSYISFVSTVGVEVPEGFFEDMVQKGLNHINISCYGIDSVSYQKIHGVDRSDLVMKNMEQLAMLVARYSNTFTVTIWGLFVSDRPKDHQAYLVDAPEEKIIEFKQRMIDHGFSYIDSKLHNYGILDINPLSNRPVKPCGILKGRLSRILTINWDLKVVPCCMVMDQEIVFGDMHEKSLCEIFYDKQWTDFREAHKKMTTKNGHSFCWKCMQDSNECGRNLK
jgi:MoaA/NifB/PqqE/SkfB family radical SAM enzyme